ncbi:hypothetical protein [Brevibacillus sp. NRS-1366]|uniref:hypothetical protein n=1 Tax=Brevibacillus sp. NRS-1366 TaxID=3233899 RepID=UPI003D2267CB
MDSVLVEKITRLVLAKLEERPSVHHLSAEEIKHWNDITLSIQGAKIANTSFDSAALPLSNAEIKRWNEITASMQGTRERGQVTFNYN